MDADSLQVVLADTCMQPSALCGSTDGGIVTKYETGGMGRGFKLAPI